MTDFDKEAEREKLREKYEKDQQRRETTEKMSELLLQGATMTNNHCAECGDPIFRYDGQEFCPTCERPVDSGGEAADDGSDDGQETIGVAEPRDDARVQFGGDGADDTEQAADSQSTDHSRQPVDEQSADQQRRNPQQNQDPQQTPQSNEGQPQRSPRDQQHSAGQPRSIPSSDPARSPADSTGNAAGTADVTVARDSLVRTLTKFSQQAEATDDPQRAQDALAAAREAAETLAALRR